jgi:hypothetical protein
MAEQQEGKLDKLLDRMPPEDAKEIVKAVVAIVKDTADTSRGTVIKAMPDILRSVREMLGHTDTVMAKVDDLTSKTGDTREDILLKALILYEAALEAKRKGQRLVVVGPDYRFVREIIGIDRDRRDRITKEIGGSDREDRGHAESGNLAG